MNTYQIQIPFMINTAYLMYYFYKAWKTDPDIIETSRDEKVKVMIMWFIFKMMAEVQYCDGIGNSFEGFFFFNNKTFLDFRRYYS